MDGGLVLQQFEAKKSTGCNVEMVLNCNYKRFHRSVSFVDDQTGFLERHIGGAAVVYQGRKYLVLCFRCTAFSLCSRM